MTNVSSPYLFTITGYMSLVIIDRASYEYPLV